MSVKSELVQEIYNLSAISAKLDEFEKLLDPTTSAEVKAMITDIQTKVTTSKTTLESMSANYAKSTEVSAVKTGVETANTNLSQIDQKTGEIATLVGTPAEGQEATLFAAIAAGGSGGGGSTDEIKEMLQSIIDAQIFAYNYDGYVYGLSEQPTTFFQALSAIASVKYIKDEVTESIYSKQALFQSCSSLITAEFDKLKSIPRARGMFGSCSSLKEIIAPELTYIYDFYSCFSGCYALRRLYMPKLETVSSDVNCFLGNSTNLIDVVVGGNTTSSISYLSSWSPTNALLSDSTSLVDEGETFSSNLEKLLYNIREHLAANLPDRSATTSLTFTCSSGIKAAINADEETLAAFTNKNWTIA